MKKIFFTLPLFLFFGLSLFAQLQNTDPVLNMEVNLQVVGADTAADGSPLMHDSVLYAANMNISLTDTAGISKIYVKFGSTEGSGNFFTRTIDYNDGDPVYSRSGYDIQIALGQYRGMRRHYAEIQVERTDHSMSDAVKFWR